MFTLKVIVELHDKPDSGRRPKSDQWCGRAPYWLKATTITATSGPKSKCIADFKVTNDKGKQWTNTLATLTLALCVQARLLSKSGLATGSDVELRDVGWLCDFFQDLLSDSKIKSLHPNVDPTHFLNRIFPTIWRNSSSHRLSCEEEHGSTPFNTGLLFFEPDRINGRSLRIKGHTLRRTKVQCSIRLNGTPCTDKRLQNICEAFESARRKSGISRNTANVPSSAFSSPFAFKLQRAVAGFVGRGWLYDEVENFIANSLNSSFELRHSGYYLLIAPPGIGKTAICAELILRRSAVHHIFSRGGYAGQLSLMTSLYEQLTAKHRLSIRAPIPSDSGKETYLVNLFSEVSNCLKHAEHELIVLDALDESDSFNQHMPWLPTHLPRGLFVFATIRGSRKESIPLTGAVPNLSVRYYRHIRNDHERDVETYIAQLITSPKLQEYIRSVRTSSRELTAELLKRSQLNFMYLHYIIPELASGNSRYNSIEELPAGLESYYEEHWDFIRVSDEKAWYEYRLPTLIVLAESSVALPIKKIAAYASADIFDAITPFRVEKAIREFDRFLMQERRPIAEGETYTAYQIYHSHFKEYLRIQGRERERDHWVAVTDNMAFLQTKMAMRNHKTS